MEESIRMGLFLGYICEQIFIFFRKHESPKKVKGSRKGIVHASWHVFKMGHNSGSTKHIKMTEMLKYSVFQAQFVIKIFRMCRVFLVHILASE